jgi:hypothetical protein
MLMQPIVEGKQQSGLDPRERLLEAYLQMRAAGEITVKAEPENLAVAPATEPAPAPDDADGVMLP